MSVIPNLCCDETKNQGAYTRLTLPKPFLHLNRSNIHNESLGQEFTIILQNYSRDKFECYRIKFFKDSQLVLVSVQSP